MTKREFFIVMVRLFALYMICSEVMTMFVSVPYVGFNSESVRLIASTIVTSVLLIVLIVSADKIVDALKMTSGLNEEFSGPSLSGRNLVQIGIILIGLNISLSTLLDVVLEIFDLFREEVASDIDSAFDPYAPSSGRESFVSLIYVAFGFLMVWKSGWMTSLIMKKSELER